ncbi:MocR-like pyridoxine biosynthesis transcription factor PdxR [Kushneria aurantia]|uniref:PLP-dependent aminotransferase family protein n=1 Tax=Kushneria aurantia TaxID=504092 RepID=A0ABV6FZ75_9GAMM|nr:PLP-dependent aminotransferase family protein [Kushneria aurantia]
MIFMEPKSEGAILPVIDALGIQLAEPSKAPLHKQLYCALREMIQVGQLASGERIPASRHLARELKLGRNTVLTAIDQLVAEGFLETYQGAGTYVAELPFTPIAQNRTSERARLYHSALISSEAGISLRGQRLLDLCESGKEPSRAFEPGIPALDRFPRETWQRLLRRHQRAASTDWLDYQAQGGVPALRETLCDYLRLSRSVRCHPEQILIVQGAQQGFELIAHLLGDPGDRVCMEEPGYGGAQACFTASGFDVLPVNVDGDGMDATGISPDGRSPRLIYVTPSHQYPSGVTMSLSRRLCLLETARHHGAWVIEDDYDSEFRYEQLPIAALQGLVDNAPVIYVGTFSKVMYPGLRLGYLVLPETLVEPFRRANARLHREAQYPVQAALADFISEGHFSRHIRRMRDCYRQRQVRLRDALAPAVAQGLQLSRGQSGMHLVVWLDSDTVEQAIVRRAADAGITLSPLSSYYLESFSHPGLVLGYAGASEDEIDRAGNWLCRTLLSYMSLP